MSGDINLDQWWRIVEESVIRGELQPVGFEDSVPEELVNLARAAVCEVRMDLEPVEKYLEKSESLKSPWDAVHSLIQLRTRLRLARGDQKVLSDLRESAEALIQNHPELPTRARLHHFLGIIDLQVNKPGVALGQLTQALECVGSAACRPWIMDGISQSYLYLGARTEGRRSLRRSIVDKNLVDDHLGIAISSGSLALAELQSGEPEAALSVLDETLNRRGEHLETLSKLRLHTFCLQAALELGDEEQLQKSHEELDQCLAECGEVEVPPIGFACIARARVFSHEGNHDAAMAELDHAARLLQHPELLMLIDYWRVQLTGKEKRTELQLKNLEERIDSLDKVMEGEILSRLLLADIAMEKGCKEEAIDRLEAAYSRVVQTNQPHWLELVDGAFRKIDPARQAARSIERFSGRPAEQMALTTTEDATIIFADLAGFTQRSTELSAEEVMETVRSVFELAVPLLAQHQVRPLQHLGDGLLAACQGDDHEKRGLDFALDFVERTSLASRIRREMGESWGLDLRAGVNSGPVVFGMLGSSYKQEWLAIGKTTNLAARLQSKGEIGEVVTLPELAKKVGYENPEAIIKPYDMKGFDAPVSVMKIPIHVIEE